jgi:hypothetical protein
MCTSRLASLVCATLLPAAALAQPPSVGTSAPAPEKDAASVAWPTGSSGHGTRGVHRVEGAVAHPAGDIVLTIGGQYSVASDLFEEGDTNERHAQQISILFVPIDNLELWLRQSMVSNRNDAFEPATTQNIGDPTFGAKYSFPLTPELGVGGGVVFMLPTSAKGTGLNPSAFVLDIFAAASYKATSWLGVHFNAGYRLDNTDDIFNRTILPVQRFTAGISQENAILAGLGVDTFFRIGDEMAIGPFAEFSAGLVTAEFSESPMRATLGAKWFPFGEDAVDVAIGGDFALAGTPVNDGVMAGIPPWELFGHLTAHLNPPEPEVVAAPNMTSCITDDQCPSGQACADGYCARVIREGPATCGTDSDCSDGQVCESGFCGTVRTEAVPTFSIKGGVFDQTSGDPVGNATVAFSGVEGSALAVEYKTGNFTSWPIEAGEGLVKVTASAPGYRPTEQTVPKGKKGEIKEVAFKIQSLGEAATGEIKGSLKDSRNGKAVRKGQIFIPILNQKIKTDKEGKFTATVKAGRYQVLISGKKYVTQKKEIEIRAGDTVILNLDMSRK